MASNHPLRLQRVWTSNVLVSLRSKIHGGVGSNGVTKLTATGIPPRMVLATQIEAFEGEVSSKLSALGSTVTDLQIAVKNSLLENFRVEGVVLMTPSQMERIMERMFEQHMGNSGNNPSVGPVASSDYRVDEIGLGMIALALGKPLSRCP